MLRSIIKQFGESMESVLKKKRKATVGKICRKGRFKPVYTVHITICHVKHELAICPLKVFLHMFNDKRTCGDCQHRSSTRRARAHTHACKHTHTRLTALFPGLPWKAGTRKVKPIWILLKQETVSGSGISWAIYKFCISLQTDNHASTPPLVF